MPIKIFRALKLNCHVVSQLSCPHSFWNTFTLKLQEIYNFNFCRRSGISVPNSFMSSNIHFPFHSQCVIVSSRFVEDFSRDLCVTLNEMVHNSIHHSRKFEQRQNLAIEKILLTEIFAFRPKYEKKFIINFMNVMNLY